MTIYNKKQKGFTLVEIIVVLVILAILAAVAIPSMIGFVNKSKKEKFTIMAESVERAIQKEYIEAYGQGYEILQMRTNFRDNGKDHYSDILFCYKKGAINSAYLVSDSKVKKDIIDKIAELSELDDYKLNYLSFAYNHTTHQIDANTENPRIAGQGMDTEIVLKKKDNSETVRLKLDAKTNNWYIVE